MKNKIKIKPNDSISIHVIKNNEKNRAETMYHVITSYKYLQTFLSCLFNFGQHSFKIVDKDLKSKGYFCNSYRKHISKKSVIEKLLKIKLIGHNHK